MRDPINHPWHTRFSSKIGRRPRQGDAPTEPAARLPYCRSLKSADLFCRGHRSSDSGTRLPCFSLLYLVSFRFNFISAQSIVRNPAPIWHGISNARYAQVVSQQSWLSVGRLFGVCHLGVASFVSGPGMRTAVLCGRVPNYFYEEL
jgi:hypothetical protein